MVRAHSQFIYKARQYRKQTITKAALFAIIVILAALIPLAYLNIMGKRGPDRKELLQLWESSAFDEVFLISEEQLAQKPLDYFLLTTHGFSAYQLAMAQINSFNMLIFIDNCIWSLRKALLFKEGLNDGRLFYVLGKAYYYKGTGYGDLAVRYLEKARSIGFYSRDISEYLGLTYASIRDYRSSVEAFSRYLHSPIENNDFSPSDMLLLSIATSYIALGEDEIAQAYLVQCLDTSKDSNLVSIAHLNLGEILSRRGDLAGAEAQYIKVIEGGGDNAEARYLLGELYNTKGETIRARAEWRRAIQIDPSHRLARARLNML